MSEPSALTLPSTYGIGRLFYRLIGVKNVSNERIEQNFAPLYELPMTLLPGYLDWHESQKAWQRALRQDGRTMIRLATSIGAIIGFILFLLGPGFCLWYTILMAIFIGGLFMYLSTHITMPILAQRPL